MVSTGINMGLRCQVDPRPRAGVFQSLDKKYMGCGLDFWMPKKQVKKENDKYKINEIICWEIVALWEWFWENIKSR